MLRKYNGLIEAGRAAARMFSGASCGVCCITGIIQ